MSIINDIRQLLLPVKQSINNLIARGTVESIDDKNGIQRVRASLLANEVHPRLERFQNYGLTANPPEDSDCLVVFQNGNRAQGYVIAIENRKYRLKELEKGEVALFTDEGDSIVLKRDNTIVVNTKKINIISENEVNITTKDAILTCEKVEVTAPEIKVTASSKIDLITPTLSVSGLISCAGLGAGAPPVNGKVSVVGAVDVTGNIQTTGNVTSGGSVSDNVGSMSDIRTKYNAHKHASSGSVPDQQMP